MKCDELRTNFFLLREAPDSEEAREMRRHLAHCPDCARYVREMEQAADWLRPRRHPQTPAAFRRRMERFSGGAAAPSPRRGSVLLRRLRPWQAAAAVAVVVGCAALLALFFAPSRLAAGQTIAPAEAAAYFVQALDAEPRTMEVQLAVRTPRGENFAAIDADSAFVRHRLTTLREGNRLLWRMEKEGGRTAVCDGGRQWMWSPDFSVCVTGAASAGFTEGFSLLLRPHDLLAAEREIAGSGEGIAYELQEAGTEMRLTVRAPRQGEIRRGTGLDRTLGNSENTRTYVFDRDSGRLTEFRITIRREGREVEVARAEAVRYNVPVDRALLLALPALPPLSDGGKREWIDVEATDSEGIAPHRSARTAARRIAEALASGRLEPVLPALKNYPDTALVLEVYGGMQVEEVGKAYRSGSYAGWYVPVRCTLRDGRQGTLKLALRKDNASDRWYVDGGL